ncbi:ATPase [Salinirubellus salinus]|uniref:ATPase n=1 Tax=Salinirubellus salinus TaxID=1364945 RepID=A0A9E7R631_9EURY|nr:ATPase [Salinirubellus salinus]UWM56504.1 ATPase [Salinirubellus salinus]
MQLLVAGGDRVDAGKTTFSVGLCRELDAPGYKPRAGNDYWFDHDDYRRAVDAGRLYGKDARRLTGAAPGEADPEAVNPVHRLWTPVPGPKQGLLGRTGREFLVDRVGPRGDETWVVNGTADLPNSLVESLPLEGAVTVDSVPAFNDVMAAHHVPAFEALADRIAAEDRAVVESYADIARPLDGYEPDAVAVVEPRQARIYDGARYANACEVASGSAREGTLEETTENVLAMIEPRARVELPALTGAQRKDPDAVADEYAPAYEALLATALE